MNLFPAYRGTGARIESISSDWRAWKIRIPLNWRTRNYVGTTYGGSLYGAVDPILMLAFIKILGPDYIVWDKAATIRFRKPGRTTLYATITVAEDEVATVRRLVEAQTKVDREYRVDIVDAQGTVHCEVGKTVYFRRRDARA